MKKIFILLLIFLLNQICYSVETKKIIFENYKDFIAGDKLESIQVSRAGKLSSSISVKKKKLNTDEVFCAAVYKNNLYLGSGAPAAIYKEKYDTFQLIFTDKDALSISDMLIYNDKLIFSMVGSNKIYSYDNKKIRTLCELEEKNIWDIEIFDNNLLVSYSDAGKIAIIDSNGKIKEKIKIDKDKIVKITSNKEKIILSSQYANIYEFNYKNKKAIPIIEFENARATDLVITNSNEIYVSLNLNKSLVPQVDESNVKINIDDQGNATISVDDSQSQDFSGESDDIQEARNDIKSLIDSLNFEDILKQPGLEGGNLSSEAIPENEYKSNNSSNNNNAAVRRAPPDRQQIQNLAPGLSGVIYKVYFSKKIEKIFDLPGQQISDLCLVDKNIFISSSNSGKIYKLDLNNNKTGLFLNLIETSINKLYSEVGNLYLILCSGGSYYKKTSNQAEGIWTSQILDANMPAKWGNVIIEGNLFKWRIKTSYKKDDLKENNNYSPWFSSSGNANVPDGEYAVLQVKLGSYASYVSKISIFYQQYNQKPGIINVNVDGVKKARTKTNPAPGSNPADFLSFANGKKSIIINIQAQDFNNDQIIYYIYYKEKNDKSFHPLNNNEPVFTNNYEIKKNELAEGEYTFKIIATDAEDNPGDLALSDEYITKAYKVDRTPPQIKILSKNKNFVEFEVVDNLSVLNKILIKKNSDKMWKILLPVDGIIDNYKEIFKLKLNKNDSYISIKAADELNNSIIKTIELR